MEKGDLPLCASRKVILTAIQRNELQQHQQSRHRANNNMPTIVDGDRALLNSRAIQSNVNDAAEANRENIFWFNIISSEFKSQQCSVMMVTHWLVFHTISKYFFRYDIIQWVTSNEFNACTRDADDELQSTGQTLFHFIYWHFKLKNINFNVTIFDEKVDRLFEWGVIAIVSIDDQPHVAIMMFCQKGFHVVHREARSEVRKAGRHQVHDLVTSN